MHLYLLRLLALSCLIFAGSALYGPSAQADDAMPTHCNRNEIAYLDAWFGSIDPDQDGMERYESSGKLLSLCEKREHKSLVKLTYRFGKLGHQEFEAVAKRDAKFGIYSWQDTPHTGENIVFFNKGPFTYYVVLAIGQGHGVSLFKFNGKRKVASYFSAFEEGVAYQVGPMEIDIFDRSKISPITVWAKPVHMPLR